MILYDIIAYFGILCINIYIYIYICIHICCYAAFVGFLCVARIAPEFHRTFARMSNWSTLKKGITTTRPSHTQRSVFNKNTPSRRALALTSGGRNCSPAPDVEPESGPSQGYSSPEGCFSLQTLVWHTESVRPVHLLRVFPIKSPWVKLSGRLPIKLYGHENSHPLELRVCLSQTLWNPNS